jgi:hypothetical protein
MAERGAAITVVCIGSGVRRAVAEDGVVAERDRVLQLVQAIGPVDRISVDRHVHGHCLQL